MREIQNTKYKKKLSTFFHLLQNFLNIHRMLKTSIPLYEQEKNKVNMTEETIFPSRFF